MVKSLLVRFPRPDKKIPTTKISHFPLPVNVFFGKHCHTAYFVSIEQLLDKFISKVFSQKCEPAGIYLFNVNEGNTRTVCEKCSKSTVNVFDVSLFLTLNIIHTSLRCFVCVNFEQVNVGWESGDGYNAKFIAIFQVVEKKTAEINRYFLFDFFFIYCFDLSAKRKIHNCPSFLNYAQWKELCWRNQSKTWHLALDKTFI